MNAAELGPAKLVTIERHILDEQSKFPDASGDLTNLLYDLALAAKIIAREVNKAGLVNILGAAGLHNASGDDVKKLDVFADRWIFRALDHTGRVAVMASEESESIIPIPEKFRCGKYVLLFDPLDGSSNIDANAPIGTIFSIHKKISNGDRGTVEDCLQPGHRQVAAGYVLYGTSTMLVYTTGNGVAGFTLDRSIGEFILSHPDIKMPSRGKIYSVNESNTTYWDARMRAYVDWVKQEDKSTLRPRQARYIGSLVADFHRNLLYGGLFMYPGSRKDPKGKLRLLYEASPLAFVAEQAGGRAIDGERRILDLEPTQLHERTPLFIGSP
jgi:fructose-1,6-bisphosphatase I